MEILLREITGSDAESIVLLSSQLGYDISLADMKTNIEMMGKQKDNTVFVAEHDKKVIGWIGVAFVLTIQSLPFGEIRGLVVDEQSRNRQVGKLLIEKAAGWCRQKRCSLFKVKCNTKRKETHAFYRHLGFTEKKEQKVFEKNLEITSAP